MQPTLEIVAVIQDNNTNTTTLIHGNRPYFYQDIQHPLPNRKYDSVVDAINGRFLKYTTDHPDEIPQLRDEYSYESDIPYIKRVIYDSKMNLGDEPLTKCYIDTEAYNPSSRFVDFAIDELRSISIITHDNKRYVIYNLRNIHAPTTTKQINDNTVYIYAPTESVLLDYFYELTQNESMFIGWNLREFDYMFLRIRSIRYNRYDFNKHVWMDLMSLYKRFVTSYSKTSIVTSFSLENVAKQELGVSKLDKSVLFDDESIDKVMEYNLHDSELVKMIDDKTKLTSLIDSIAVTMNLLIDDCVYFSNAIEYAVMRELNGQYIFRNKTRVDALTSSKYSGAYVQEAPTGIFNNVAVFDFSSLYPNIIRTFNIGPDTIDDGGEISIPDLPYHYTNKRMSVYNKLITNLLNLREKYKKQYSQTQDETYNTIQIGVKFLIASFYGVLGFESGRLYDKRIAESITTIGQHFIKMIGNKFNSIYGDTDSVMIAINDASKENIKNIERQMNALIDTELQKYNTLASTLNIRFEKLFSKVYFYGKKKRYYGIVVMGEDYNPTNKILARGLEVRRTDWCPLAVEYETNLLKLLLEDVKQAKQYHDSFVAQLRQFSNEKFVIHKSLTKSIESYKTTPPHVKAATEHDYIGSKIPYIVTGYRHNKITSVARDIDKCTPSYEYYLKKQILPIYERLLEPFVGMQRKLGG